MSLPPEPWLLPLRVIILAGRRRGAIDPLAQIAGVSHKCLVPICGRPLIVHVVATVAAHPAVASVAISIEEDAFDAVRALLSSTLAERVRFVTASDNIADSVHAAAADHAGPIIVTTADNVLLKPASLDAVLAGLKGSDAIVALAPREAVLAQHPESQRRFYEFRDGAYSNCNLYGLGSRSALSAAETFRNGGQFARKAWRVIGAFGLVNLILLRLRLITLDRAMRRISRRLKLRIAQVLLDDGSQAIDVDNQRTFAIAETLLARKGGGPPAAAAGNVIAMLDRRRAETAALPRH